MNPTHLSKEQCEELLRIVQQMKALSIRALAVLDRTEADKAERLQQVA